MNSMNRTGGQSAKKGKGRYALLLDRIHAMGGNQRSVSREIGLSESHFCRKLAGRYDFTQEDIRLLCRLLNISAADIGRYFFAPEFESSQLSGPHGARAAG